MYDLSNKTARAGGGSTGNGSREVKPSDAPGSVQDEPLYCGPDELAEDRAEMLAERRAREADDAELRRVEG